VEGRLQGPALAQVVSPFGGQQAVAQQDLGSLQRLTLGQATLVTAEDPLDQSRLEQHPDLAAQDVQAAGFGMLAGKLAK
jgi:hypothetical protein